MGSRTVWILLAFVLLLGGIALWQLERESAESFATDRPLFDGVRAERVQSIRIDNLERGLQLTMARDANGGWQIVDPLTYPAEMGVLERLFEVFTRNRAIPVDEPDLAALSLSPPRAVLEIVELLPSGERKLRLELGAKDLDGKHVFARVDGSVVRTLLNLDSTLERDLADWRQRRILAVDPASVVEIRRLGKLALDPGQGLVDLAFEAGVTEAGWRATAPWKAAVDPGVIAALLANTCYMQARTFLADSAAEVAAFGLDQPDLRLDLVAAGGSEHTLLLKREPLTESWVCMREGSTHVFKVDDVGIVVLSIPSAEFLDQQLVRVANEEVLRVELRNGKLPGHLSLRRDGKQWRLQQEYYDVRSGEVRADSEAVLDLLAEIANARAARFLVEHDLTTFFGSDPPSGLSVVTAGAEYSIEFGAEHEASPGVRGRQFRRAGETVWGVVEERIAALALRELTDLVDHRLIKLPELAIASIELSQGDFKRKFVRDANTGRWSPEGANVEAPKAFLKCVERLLSLRADQVVVMFGDFVDPWQVVVIDGGGVRTSYFLGALKSDPAEHGFDDGRVRGIVTSSGLLDDLALIP